MSGIPFLSTASPGHARRLIVVVITTHIININTNIIVIDVVISNMYRRVGHHHRYGHNLHRTAINIL